MHVLYEEEGGFKVGTVLADNAASLQVEAPHGKRSKIKTANVLLQFKEPTAQELMSRAQLESDQLDVDFLWQVASQNEFSFADLGREYFGHEPSAIESAALLMRLHGAPMYFYKRGKGRYKAAPEDALKAALASVERKRKQEELKNEYLAQLSRGALPEAFRPMLAELVYKPDKNKIEYKALESASVAMQLSIPKVLHRVGGLASPYDYHVGRFLLEYFPHGVGFGEVSMPPVEGDLPAASVAAFSIDDATTTEIDDAFSVTLLADGNFRVGIHIAAPALSVTPGSPLDVIARTRLSTIYTPNDKITMLPPAAIEAFTLAAGRDCAALSLYLTVAADGYRVLASESRVERVTIAANLRHDQLEHQFNETALTADAGDYAFKRELRALWRLANHLEQTRAKTDRDAIGRVDYNFYVQDDRVRIVGRARGTPIDKVVAELMIFANATWGKMLAEANAGAIYRAQGGGLTQMTTQPAPHEGLGVAQYAWSSSPLRRYVDLINQRQLIALITGRTPQFPSATEELMTIARDFDQTYEAYAEFQRSMERYWCLRYVQQEDIKRAPATALRDNVVRLNDFPLFAKAHGADLTPGTQVTIEFKDIDLWELTATCRAVSN